MGAHQGVPRNVAAIDAGGRLYCLPCLGDREADGFYDEGNAALHDERCEACGAVAVWTRPAPEPDRTFSYRYEFHGESV